MGRRRLLTQLIRCSTLSAATVSGSLTACGGGSLASTGGATLVPASRRRPAIGGHAISFNFQDVPSPALLLPSLKTRPFGSTLLVSVGRGIASTHVAPRDTPGNDFLQLGARRTYSLWPDSGTALFSCLQARGALDHVVSVPKSAPRDETTLSLVEVVNGGVLVDWKWSEVVRGRPTTTETVTTTGPAVIVAWWWGDAGVDLDKMVRVDQGFRVLDSVLHRGALVQCAVAVRQVELPGMYQTTWSATPDQGAQLWIAAVQSNA